MTHSRRSPKTLRADIGLFATLRASRHDQESCAPTHLPASRAAFTFGRSLASILAAAALLALTAPSALAAPAKTFAGFGGGAGQVGVPTGAAVDQSSGTESSGNVYLADTGNHRIDIFEADGTFLRAFGYGIRTGAEELQTCTAASGCREATIGSAPGQMSPFAVAVDNSSGASKGDLYVADLQNHRVQKFGFNPLTEEFEFLLMFGGEVDKTNGAGVCTKADLEAGDTCGAGVPGAGPGAFSFDAVLTVDASGQVWVGDENRLEQFSPTGAFLSEVELPGAGVVESLAVDSSGDFYLIAESLPGVRKLESDGTPIETLDQLGNPRALALDPATEDLFVVDQLDQEHTAATLLIYGSNGAETEAFGTGEVIGHPIRNGLAFGDAAQRLYVTSAAGVEKSVAQIFTLSLPGPLVAFDTTKATEIHKTAATLNAEVNPEGAETTYRFQYITAAQFKQNEEEGHEGFAGAEETTESASVGEDFTQHPASAAISGLAPATAYRFRLIATNECEPGQECVGNSEEEEGSFETLPPAAIDSTSASKVSADSATLEAEINPLGDATSYHFEYLTEAEYQHNLNTESFPFFGAAQAPLSEAPIGAGTEDVAVSQRVQGLSSHTAYRFRVVATNSVAPAGFPGPEKTFTTQTPGPLILPDGRQWEMVSPPDKHGAGLTVSSEGQEEALQAAVAGDAIVYLASAATEAQPQGFGGPMQVLSTRGPQGWSSHDLAPLHSGPTGKGVGQGAEYRLFSNDLSLGALQPFGAFEPSLSAEASEQTSFLRTDYPSGDLNDPCLQSCYRPLVTGAPGFANVPEGTAFGEEGQCPTLHLICGPLFRGATPDFSHAVFSSPVALTPTGGTLYEWSAGRPPAEQLQSVSVLPVSEGGAAVAGSLGNSPNGRRASAISAGGTRVVWTRDQGGGKASLYLRDTAKGETVKLDAVQAGAPGVGDPTPKFQLASADGSKVFFTDSQALTGDSGAEGSGESAKRDLYECEILETAGELECKLSDLTPQSAGEPADVQGTLPGAGEDGSLVYFVADGALTGAEENDNHETAQAGQPNLYLRHGGATKLVAVLSPNDFPDWAGGGLALISTLSARVSPDGGWLAFMSQRPLTGYDNRDAISGHRDEEVYLYDAETARLLCASCDPTGARPLGTEFSESAGNAQEEQFLGGRRAWSHGSSLAAIVPGWTLPNYQSRYLSDSGRLFFESHDALVPQDSNGTWDVYQYEPPGVGSCTESSPTFAERSGGCLGLISSGASKEPSAFLDASESGDDVFFLTNAKLSPQDFDTSLDLYDARVGGGFPEPVKPVECEGDACQPPAVPPNHPTPGTVLLDGPGNVHEPPPGRKKHPKKHHKHKKSHHKRAASHHRGGNN